jgi:hypothetical protein
MDITAAAIRVDVATAALGVDVAAAVVRVDVHAAVGGVVARLLEARSVGPIERGRGGLAVDARRCVGIVGWWCVHSWLWLLLL